MPPQSTTNKSGYTSLPFSPDKLPLGTLLHDLSNPRISTWSPPTELRLAHPPAFAEDIEEHGSYNGALDRTSETSVLAKITKFFTVSHEEAHASQSNVEAKGGSEHYLKDPSGALEVICEHQAARDWIQKTIQHPRWKKMKTVYMVVGYRVFVDSELSIGSANSSQTAVQAEAPVAEGAGLSPQASNAVNPGLEMQQKSSDSSSEQMNLPGARVHEIYYAKLSFEIFAPRAAPKLGKKCFRLTTKNRGGPAAKEADSEVVEVKFNLSD